jgi:hypothetical protein
LTGNPELIAQYRDIHASRVYGDTSIKNLRFLRADIALLKPQSILDYGCGQSRLLEALRLDYPVELRRYDPAIPKWSAKPTARADLLLNIDVLEHIEEKDLDAVLADMAGTCRDALIIIDTKPAATILADGRNAHATIRPHAWWRQRLAQHFPELHAQATARSSRAGFKTWTRPRRQTPAYLCARAADEIRHYLGWLGAPLAGS